MRIIILLGLSSYRIVILSEVGTSRSEVPTKSKDPYVPPISGDDQEFCPLSGEHREDTSARPSGAWAGHTRYPKNRVYSVCFLAGPRPPGARAFVGRELVGSGAPATSSQRTFQTPTAPAPYSLPDSARSARHSKYACSGHPPTTHAPQENTTRTPRPT